MSPNAVTPRAGGWALFLDVDGTLLNIAETPQGVQVPPNLKVLLSELHTRLDGAVALISGRSLADLDRLFAPLRLCAAGIHGCERRSATGLVSRPQIDAAQLASARSELQEFVHRHEGLLLEDKGYGLAVHFRRAPDLSADVRARMKTLLERLGPEFALQPGKCVFELRPASGNKGASVAAFMSEPPFEHRNPIYIGDDVTDEDAFAVVNSMQGLSIRVGDAAATLAQYRLSGVAEVLRWLEANPPAITAAPEHT